MGDLNKLQQAEAYILTDTSLTASISTTDPVGTESAVIVRNIVSGTQSVSGTTTIVPSGTQTVSGSVSINYVTTTINHNQKTVTTAATQITTASTSLTFGILIKASNANTQNVYVGAASVSSINGYELGVGENITLPVDNANRVYVLSPSGTQSVSWIGL